MDGYQYLIGGTLCLLMSLYVLLKPPRTLASKFLVLFGLAMWTWEISSFLYTTAPDVIASANFFRIMILTSHLGFPLYLLTILSVGGKSSGKTLLLILIPAVAQVAIMSQDDYIVNYEFFLTQYGWTYRVVSFHLPFVIGGIIFVGYLAGIVIALVGLIKKASFPLLKRKYLILLLSFVSFQAVGTILSNALIALNLLSPIFHLGGMFKFLTIISIWYALSLREKGIPLAIAGKDFSQVYSSFLTVFYNSIISSQLGEEYFKFTDFITKSKIENQVSLAKDKIDFVEKEDIDLVELVTSNLRFFDKNPIADGIADNYLRVLNVASQNLGWRFEGVVKANEDFLKKSDLIYGISDGKFLEGIVEDESLRELDDIDACLKIYKRILLPVVGKIQKKPEFQKELSKHHLTRAVMISDYGEISIQGVRERLVKLPQDEQVPIAVERFNSILSSVYENLLMDPKADVEGILEKLRLVLTLNKERAVALGVYPTLLGMLATKIPKTQIHRLYFDYLQELVEERTRELKEAQESLLKSQRLAAIGEAAAMVGHDLRNPLQAIVNSLYLAEKKLESSPNVDLAEIIKTMGEQVEYANKIVSDLQDYARPLKPKLEQISVQQLVNDTFSTISAPEAVKVSVEIEEDLDFPKLLVDASFMKRVFANLVMNALQAMPDGGQLTIRVSRTPETVFIQFQDTGVGIPEENLDKLFQPLFTTKAKGLGLGLAVCKRLVEALNGSITVKSNAGKGTIFIIELPSKALSHQTS